MERKNILVVERNRDIAQLITDVLTEAGYAVTVIEPEAALADVARSADLLILDVVPRSLIAACSQYLALDPSTCAIPTIGLSTLKETEARAMGLRADLFVGKPFDIQQLVAAVHACIGAGTMEGGSVRHPAFPFVCNGG